MLGKWAKEIKIYNDRQLLSLNVNILEHLFPSLDMPLDKV